MVISQQAASTVLFLDLQASLASTSIPSLVSIYPPVCVLILLPFLGVEISVSPLLPMNEGSHPPVYMHMRMYTRTHAQPRLCFLLVTNVLTRPSRTHSPLPPLLPHSTEDASSTRHFSVSALLRLYLRRLCSRRSRYAGDPDIPPVHECGQSSAHTHLTEAIFHLFCLL